ncbi:unnamed protein product, partial [marine sediment metagenome]
HKQAVSTIRPNLSELKTGLQDLAPQNERKAESARFWLISLTKALKSVYAITEMTTRWFAITLTEAEHLFYCSHTTTTVLHGGKS